MTVPTSRRRSLRSTCTTTIGVLLVATGAAHGLLVLIGYATTPPPAERAARTVMAATSIPVAGMERSSWDLFQGFSLMTALLLVGLGSLVLLIRRKAPDLVDTTRAVQILLGLVLMPALVISVLLLPPPPMVLLGLATVAAIAALVRRPAT